MKTGIVQTTSQTADFSRNLRAVVQGYRYCVDHGADIVVADAFALCGPYPGDLMERSSFLNQTQEALKALAAEIGSVPLLLGAWAIDSPSSQEMDLWSEEEVLPETATGFDEDPVALMPFLLEQDTVSVVQDEVVTLENGVSFYASCKEELDAFGFDADFFVILPPTPWHVGGEAKNEESLAWEAKQEKKPLVCVRPAGGSDGKLWGGGSTVHASDGRLLARLPLFEAAECVVGDAHDAHKPVPQLPDPAVGMRRALEMGLRDHVQRNGYEGVGIVLDGRPHSLLLALLAVGVFGAEHVALWAHSSPSADDLTLLTRVSLDDRVFLLPGDGEASAMPDVPEGEKSLECRLLMARAASEAETMGVMLLSSLCRGELLAGKGLELAWGALLLPLGDLYEGDLRLMAARMSEEGLPVPPFFAETADDAPFERAFQLLEDNNQSATELLARSDCPLDEAVMRKAQRLLIASAWKRRCLPPVLAVTGDPRHYPAMHRLND